MDGVNQWGSTKIDHYILTELSARASWHTAATRIIYREFLELWIRPYWSTTNIRNVRTVAVEHWLGQLRRHNKAPLGNSTKAKIRSLHERSIQSCVYNRTIGKCKTASSKKDLPLPRYVAAELMYWQQRSKYQKGDDWVFASPRLHGRYPYWPAMLLTRTIRPAAVRAGIEKRLAWHTFRHTYSTMLVANGENVKSYRN